jgi:magnesium chelatase subunit ChlD-like protein
VFNNSDAYWWEGGKKVEAGEQFAPRKLQTNLDKLTRKHAGRRSRTRTDRKRGHYIQARPAGNKTDDIAFDATLRAAAPFQKQRADQLKASGMAYALKKSDLYRKIRVDGQSDLIRGGCVVEHGGFRADERDQGRDYVPADGCLPTA